MTFRSRKLLDADEGKPCVRCGGETWKDISGFIGYYRISCLGRVFSIRKNRIMTPNLAGRGPYLQAHLYRDSIRTLRYVHHLVLTEFVGPRPTPEHQACHGANGMHDNRLVNLRWDTREANLLDVVLHGSQKGERNPASKLQVEDVVEIRNARISGESVVSIASRFGISSDYVYRIAAKKSWMHV